MKNNKILDSDQIERKFQRMARQLLEAHHSEPEIILMGIVCTASKEEIQSKVVVIVDDVLNSGKTLIYAVKHILDSGPKGVYTTVLVDRIHRSFPVRADYCGLSLSTHLNEHISVKLSKTKAKSDAVFLEL